MSTDRKYVIPHRLDDPPRFLWWDFDVAILAMGCVALGIMTGQILIFTIMGGVSQRATRRLKLARTGLLAFMQSIGICP